MDFIKEVKAEVSWGQLPFPVSHECLQSLDRNELIRAFEETASELYKKAVKMDIPDSFWNVREEPLYYGLMWLWQRARKFGVPLSPTQYRGTPLQQRLMRAHDPLGAAVDSGTVRKLIAECVVEPPPGGSFVRIEL